MLGGLFHPVYLSWPNRTKAIDDGDHDKLVKLMRDLKWTICSSQKSFDGIEGPEAAKAATEEVHAWLSQ